MAEVVWSERALIDLEAIYLFLARDAPEYARLTNRRLYRATERLAEFPQSGRIVPEWSRPNIREIIAQGYRIVYQIDKGVIEVLTVHHSARALTDL